MFLLVHPQKPFGKVFLPHSLLYLQLIGVSVEALLGKGVAKKVCQRQPQALPLPPVLLAFHLAGSLVEGIPQDGVLLLQASQLCVGAVLQLFLQGPDLEEPNKG